MITQLSFKNFKCFEQEQIELSSFNLLTGLNGMGKSSVIQALLLLRQNYLSNTLDKRLSLNGSLVNCGNAKDILYQYFTEPVINIELHSEDGNYHGWNWEGQSDGDSLALFQHYYLVKPEFENWSLFNAQFHYLNAERLGPRTFFETSTHSVVNENQIGTRGEYAANYYAIYLDENIKVPALAHPGANNLSLREQVNAWMGEIRPGTRVNVTTSEEMGLVALSYQFALGDLGNRFRPTNVGFGLSYVFPLLIAVLASEPGTLLLLENPEAHLHPRGQAQMGRLLALAAANGIQVIVESHSDHILNGVRVAVKEGILPPEEANLLFFTGDVIDGKFTHYIETPKINRNGKLDYRPDGFFDEWDQQLTKLL